MTKAILESGSLKETEDHYELAGSLQALVIPATLQDSLMARLDRLMTAKVIAQLGAAIGRQFSYALLHAVSQLDEVMLQHELGRLVEAEIVYQRGLPPQATYVFKHALIQDAAYAVTPEEHATRATISGLLRCSKPNSPTRLTSNPNCWHITTPRQVCQSRQSPIGITLVKTLSNAQHMWKPSAICGKGWRCSKHYLRHLSASSAK